MTDREYQRIYLIVEKALVTPEMRRHLATLTAFGDEPEIERLREQLAAANVESNRLRAQIASQNQHAASMYEQMAAANAEIERLRDALIASQGNESLARNERDDARRERDHFGYDALAERERTLSADLAAMTAARDELFELFMANRSALDADTASRIAELRRVGGDK